LATWFSLTESQRLDLVTDLSRNPALTPDVVAFLRSVIQDRERGIVTRNNAANALVGQEIKDPTLAAVFKRMVDDASETEQWRDYSLQFLAVSVDWSNDPEAMAATIWQMATNGPGSIPGTALLHLHYMDQRAVALLPGGYEDYLAKLLAQENADLPSRMTVAGIAGQRGMIELAPQLRKAAEHAAQPALRRVALAALGQINDPADIAFVQRFTNDSDVLIAAAAKGAEQRLLAAQQKDLPINP
jgi:HEAT repeat protein